MLSEDRIMKHLDQLLSSSEPGAQLHHLHVVSAPRGVTGPLGLIEDEKTHFAVYAIAPGGGDQSPEQYVAQTVMLAAVEAAKQGEAVFAGVSQEMWTVFPPDDLCRELRGRLEEHPRAVEVTVVYAACRDGRRWRGLRWLTGERAGQTDNVELLVGTPNRYEGSGVLAAPMLRRLVGMTV